MQKQIHKNAKQVCGQDISNVHSQIITIVCSVVCTVADKFVKPHYCIIHKKAASQDKKFKTHERTRCFTS